MVAQRAIEGGWIGIFHHVGIFFGEQIASLTRCRREIVAIAFQNILRQRRKLAVTHDRKGARVILTSSAPAFVLHLIEHLPLGLDDRRDQWLFFCPSHFLPPDCCIGQNM